MTFLDAYYRFRQDESDIVPCVNSAKNLLEYYEKHPDEKRKAFGPVNIDLYILNDFMEMSKYNNPTTTLEVLLETLFLGILVRESAFKDDPKFDSDAMFLFRSIILSYQEWDTGGMNVAKLLSKFEKLKKKTSKYVSEKINT